jgi:uncharacterized surface anchored protein
VKNDIHIHKTSSETGEGIRNIKFRLFGVSDYGNQIDMFQTSDRNGHLGFEDIEKGSYILYEYEATPD